MVGASLFSNKVEKIMNTTSVDTATEVHTALRATAMLVDVSISKWGGTVSDAAALEEIKIQKGATGDVGRFMKNLLAGHDAELRALNSSLDAIRTTHYKLTLPWVLNNQDGAGRNRGARLLPTALFDRYTKEIGMLRRNMMQRRDAFLAVYEQRAMEAKINLGELAHNTEYPTVDRLRNSFGVVVDFAPIPDGSHFTGLPDATLQKLGSALNERVDRMVSTAMEHAWTLVRDRLKHTWDRLADPDKKFHASMVEHNRELVELLKAFNITGDPRLEEIRQEIAQHIAPASADELRDNVESRTSVASEARRLLDRLNEWKITAH